MSEPVDWDDEPTPVRTARAYRYRDSGLAVLHQTSVPMNDEEALEYFHTVSVWFMDRPAKYVEVERLESNKYELLPYQYDFETDMVSELE